MEMMETNVSAEPLQNCGQFVKRTPLHAGFEIIPLGVTFPVHPFVGMLDVKQPHAHAGPKEKDQQLYNEVGSPPEYKSHQWDDHSQG